MTLQSNKTMRILILYYGIIQCVHILMLTRAGIILILGNQIPFPIFPPVDGWHSQTFPFLLGLAVVDLVAIIMGIIFTFQMVVKARINWLLGILSLTIAIASAIVFAIGTYASGAWNRHPISYWVMVLLFAPAILLFLQLLRSGPSVNED